MLREIFEETGLKFTSNVKTNEFFLGSHKCQVQPILLYESLYPDWVENPKFQTVVVFFKVTLPVSHKNLKMNINLSEVDAYVWVKIEDIFKMIFDKSFSKSVRGYKWSYIKNEFVSTEFTEKNFRPTFIDAEKGYTDPKVHEYVQHGHRTSIQMIYKNLLSKK